MDLRDQVLDEVRWEVDRTEQRTTFGPWRSLMATRFAGFAAVGAVVVLAVVIVVSLGGGPLIGGDPSLSPSEQPSIAASAAPSTAATGDATLIEPQRNMANSYQGLPAGSYYVDTPYPIHLSVEVPGGVGAFAYLPAGTQINFVRGDEPGELSFAIVDNVVADPCSTELLDPPVGPTVDDLVEALSSLDGFEATAATDVTIDGYDGKQFTLTAPGQGEARCYEMRTWHTTTRQNDLGLGDVAEVQIVDVAGVRLLVSIAYQASESSADRPGLEGILMSVQLEP
jgi:hypothetical protein